MEDTKETPFKKDVDSMFRELLEKNAIRKSTRAIPSNMVILIIIISIPDSAPPPLTRIEPYMPSQNRIVKGFKKAISKPAKRECLNRTILRNLGSIEILFNVNKFSIPVYMSTKKPKHHKNILIYGESINCPTPK